MTAAVYNKRIRARANAISRLLGKPKSPIAKRSESSQKLEDIKENKKISYPSMPSRISLTRQRSGMSASSGKRDAEPTKNLVISESDEFDGEEKEKLPSTMSTVTSCRASLIWEEIKEKQKDGFPGTAETTADRLARFTHQVRYMNENHASGAHTREEKELSKIRDMLEATNVAIKQQAAGNDRFSKQRKLVRGKVVEWGESRVFNDTGPRSGTNSAGKRGLMDPGARYEDKEEQKEQNAEQEEQKGIKAKLLRGASRLPTVLMKRDQSCSSGIIPSDDHERKTKILMSALLNQSKFTVQDNRAQSGSIAISNSGGTRSTYYDKKDDRKSSWSKAYLEKNIKRLRSFFIKNAESDGEGGEGGANKFGKQRTVLFEVGATNTTEDGTLKMSKSVERYTESLTLGEQMAGGMNSLRSLMSMKSPRQPGKLLLKIRALRPYLVTREDLDRNFKNDSENPVPFIDWGVFKDAITDRERKRYKEMCKADGTLSAVDLVGVLPDSGGKEQGETPPNGNGGGSGSARASLQLHSTDFTLDPEGLLSRQRPADDFDVEALFVTDAGGDNAKSRLSGKLGAITSDIAASVTADGAMTEDNAATTAGRSSHMIISDLVNKQLALAEEEKEMSIPHEAINDNIENNDDSLMYRVMVNRKYPRVEKLLDCAIGFIKRATQDPEKKLSCDDSHLFWGKEDVRPSNKASPIPPPSVVETDVDPENDRTDTSPESSPGEFTNGPVTQLTQLVPGLLPKQSKDIPVLKCDIPLMHMKLRIKEWNDGAKERCSDFLETWVQHLLDHPSHRLLIDLRDVKEPPDRMRSFITARMIAATQTVHMSQRVPWTILLVSPNFLEMKSFVHGLTVTWSSECKLLVSHTDRRALEFFGTEDEQLDAEDCKSWYPFNRLDAKTPISDIVGELIIDRLIEISNSEQTIDLTGHFPPLQRFPRWYYRTPELRLDIQDTIEKDRLITSFAFSMNLLERNANGMCCDFIPRTNEEPRVSEGNDDFYNRNTVKKACNQQ